MEKIAKNMVASFLGILVAFCVMLYFVNPVAFSIFYGVLGFASAAIYTLFVWGLSWCVIFPKLMGRAT